MASGFISVNSPVWLPFLSHKSSKRWNKNYQSTNNSFQITAPYSKYREIIILGYLSYYVRDQGIGVENNEGWRKGVQLNCSRERNFTICIKIWEFKLVLKFPRTEILVNFFIHPFLTALAKRRVGIIRYINILFLLFPQIKDASHAPFPLFQLTCCSFLKHAFIFLISFST